MGKGEEELGTHGLREILCFFKCVNEHIKQKHHHIKIYFKAIQSRTLLVVPESRVGACSFPLIPTATRDNLKFDRYFKDHSGQTSWFGKILELMVYIMCP